jgi:hypothetical protein
MNRVNCNYDFNDTMKHLYKTIYYVLQAWEEYQLIPGLSKALVQKYLLALV